MKNLHVLEIQRLSSDEAIRYPTVHHWERILLSLRTPATDEVVKLMDFEWDSLELISWLNENLTLYQDGLVGASSDESLATALNRLQEQAITDEDFEAIYQLKTMHSLRFAVRGARVPPIVFARRDGIGEVSLDMKTDPSVDFYQLRDPDYRGYFLDGSWAYTFDFEQFVLHVASHYNALT